MTKPYTAIYATEELKLPKVPPEAVELIGSRSRYCRAAGQAPPGQLLSVLLFNQNHKSHSLTVSPLHKGLHEEEPTPVSSPRATTCSYFIQLKTTLLLD